MFNILLSKMSEGKNYVSKTQYFPESFVKNTQINSKNKYYSLGRGFSFEDNKELQKILFLAWSPTGNLKKNKNFKPANCLTRFAKFNKQILNR